MSEPDKHTACIIGGGMSGLITGALLAKNGYKVTVLEKNHIIGGGLQSFRRGDAVFNTGMQVMCGYEKPFALKYLFKYLDITKEQLSIIPIDSQAQAIVWTDSYHCYRLPKSREDYEQYLISCFPHEQNGIKSLINEIYTIGEAFNYFNYDKNKYFAAIPYNQISALSFLQKYVTDFELITLFEYIGMAIGCNLSAASAVEFSLLISLYTEGAWQIAGGNINLAKSLEKVIIDRGGQVISDSQVTKVTVREKRCVNVETISGRNYSAEVFVSSISPTLLLNITDKIVFRESTQYRIKSFQNDNSGCLISMKLKSRMMKYKPHIFFLPALKEDMNLPRYISMLTPPRNGQDEWADTLEILMFDHYSKYKKWENTLTGQRGDEYESLKKEIATQLIDYVSQFYPDVKNAIEKVYVATPLTIRDYYGNINGVLYSQQGLFIPIRTQLQNLYVTGQAIQYQGLFGVAITSITTVETILKRSLIKEILNA